MNELSLTIEEIPTLLKMSKKLIITGYIAPLNARKLARQCRLIADSAPEGYDKLDALDAVKGFSYWLHERINNDQQ